MMGVRGVLLCLGLAVLAVGGGACAKDVDTEPTEVPGGAAGAEAEQGPAPPQLPGATPEVKKPAPAGSEGPLPKDRDPEAERRKMSLSKERSAEAERMLKRGQFSDAIQQARQALRVHEQNVDAMLVIAEASLKQGMHELASATTNSALNVDSKLLTAEQISRAYNIQGFAFLKAGKPQAATEAFRKASVADAKNAAAWNNLGTRYLDAGDVATAVKCFRYATDLAPRFHKAYLNLGAALRAERNWTEAEAALRKALELRPNYPEAYFDLGVLYLDADNYPGLEVTTRMNKAIQNLTKYRELAIASGAAGPADPTRGGDLGRPGGAAGEGRVPGGVSPAIADDYIAVAKKGIEREQRRKEREEKRKEREAEQKRREEEKQKEAAERKEREAEEAAKRAKEQEKEQPSPQKPGESQGEKPPPPTQPTPQKPGESQEEKPPPPPPPPSPQKPGEKPAPPPTQPSPQKPGQPPPPQPSPQRPGQNPSKQAPGSAAAHGHRRGTRGGSSTLTVVQEPISTAFNSPKGRDDLRVNELAQSSAGHRLGSQHRRKV